MKIRTGFVANSSSSDYVDDDESSRDLDELRPSGKTIYVSSRLHNRMIKLRENGDYQGILYMLGANRVGVCCQAIPLEKNGGCEYMPGAKSTTLARGYIIIANKGLKFAGFGYTRASEDERPDWFNDYGSGIEEAAGVIFLCYMQGGTSAQIYHNNDIKSVEVAVVPATYIPRRNAVK